MWTDHVWRPVFLCHLTSSHLKSKVGHKCNLASERTWSIPPARCPKGRVWCLQRWVCAVGRDRNPGSLKASPDAKIDSCRRYRSARIPGESLRHREAEPDIPHDDSLTLSNVLPQRMSDSTAESSLLRFVHEWSISQKSARFFVTWANDSETQRAYR